MKWGQAMIEFALILPLMLFVILGGASLGWVLIDRGALQHTAQEAAVSGAQAAHSQRCDTALRDVPLILGRDPTSATCHGEGDIIVVELSDTLPSLAPFFDDFHVHVVGRAVGRTQ